VNARGSGQISPSKLKSFYSIGNAAGDSRVSQGVFESSGQSYSPADLKKFQQHFGLARETVASDKGGHSVSQSFCQQSSSSCDEANLDVQYLMGMSTGTPTTYWDMSTGSTEAAFADGLENWIHQVAGDPHPPLVNSISYGAPEFLLDPATMKVFNNEAKLLGLQGVTIVVSSGDDGVAGPLSRPGMQQQACSYRPNFPASSPYVTTVGATQGPESDLTEIACSAHTGGGITTGGGFSTVFAQPDYQRSAVSGYFAALPSQPKAGFNQSGRAYPDVALAGHAYQVYIGGQLQSVDGTSASAPVFAAMVSLANAERKRQGKPALGFLNHKLYSNSAASSFNDIVDGSNKCTAGGQSFFGVLPPQCCCEGFDATAGWDPVTGLGSVDYARFLQSVLA